jgi:hypothetical protein
LPAMLLIPSQQPVHSYEEARYGRALARWWPLPRPAGEAEE